MPQDDTSAMTYHCTPLRAGRLLLDAGGMFGLIPRVVWEKVVTPDDRHRVELAHNCLWLVGTRDDPELGRPRQVVIETGSGDTLDEKMAAIFGLDGVTVDAALRDAGGDPDAIDDVIVSHLHFDHAGGLTRRVRAGETPNWTTADDTGGHGMADGGADGVRLTFPNARVHTQRLEWSAAWSGDSVMTRTYYRENLLPVRDRLVTHDAAPPFAPGLPPHRQALPALPLERRCVRALPGVRVFRVPGHTWGQQAVWFADAQRGEVVFAADLIPTAWHAGRAYSLAYDVEAYTTMLTKSWFLAQAAERGWTLALDHDPHAVFHTVQDDGKGWYALARAAT